MYAASACIPSIAIAASSSSGTPSNGNQGSNTIPSTIAGKISALTNGTKIRFSAAPNTGNSPPSQSTTGEVASHAANEILHRFFTPSLAAARCPSLVRW